MSTSTRVLKNTGFLYVRMGVTVVISLYTTRLILNSLGASDFGIFGIVGGTIAMLGFLKSAMAAATQRYMNFYQGKGDSILQLKIFNNSIILHWLLAILIGVILEIAGLFLFDGVLNIPPERIIAAKWIYQFAIASTLFSIITVPYDAAINAHENMLYYAIVGIIESTLKLVIAIVIVNTSSDKLILYGLLMALLSITMLFVKRVYCRTKYQECHLSLRKYYDKPFLKELTSFAGWNFVSSAGVMIGNFGGDIVVNHFFGTIVNAAQNVGSQLRGQMMAFSNNMLKALNPVITKSAGAGNESNMIKYALTGSKLSYHLFAMLAIPFLVETPIILKLWLKNVPEWAVCFFYFQLIISLSEQLTVTLGSVLSAVNKIKEFSIFNSITHFLPLFLYVFVFSLGAEPYWLYVIILINFGIVKNSYTVFLCRKYCSFDVSHFFKYIVIPCLGISAISFVIGYSLHFFMTEGILRLTFSLILTFITYIISAYYFGLNKDEKVLVDGLISKLKNKFIKK